MKKLISSSFSVGAIKEAVSIDYINHYYLVEDTGKTPASSDSRWGYCPNGSSAPIPTQENPFLWHKYVIVLSDGNSQKPIIELSGTVGASPFVVDLSSDMTSVALSESGLTEEDFSESFSLRAFYGSTDVTDEIGVISAVVTPSNGNISVDTSNASVIKVSIPKGKALTGTTMITFSCSHPSHGSRSVTHTIAGVRAGANGQKATIFEILTDRAQVSFSRDAYNNLSPSYIDVGVSIKKVVGSDISVVSVASSGLTLRYSFNSMPASPTSGSAVVSSIRVLSSYSNLFIAAFDGNNLVDYETISIIKDGEKGSAGNDGNDGNDGEDGNGVDEVSYYRMMTMGFSAPATNDSGWRSRSYYDEMDLSPENRYLWEKKVTSYTKTANEDSEVYLVAQFTSSPCANLLEDTAFLSDAEMEAWDVCNGYSIDKATTGLAQRGWRTSPDMEAAQTQMLEQRIFSADIKKIKGNTWYTLSFYGAMSAYTSLFLGSTYNGDGSASYYQLTKCLRYFRVEPGQTVTIRVTGRVYNSSYTKMKVWAWLNSLDMSQTWLSGTSVSADITSTSSTTVTLTLTNNTSLPRICGVCPYMLKLDGSQVDSSSLLYRGYCTSITVDRGRYLHTYITRSGTSSAAVQMPSSSPWYVDGVKVTESVQLSDGTKVMAGNDGHIAWYMPVSAKRHSITFKTSSISSASADILQVLFRMMVDSNTGWISMPKLEENTMATDWMESTEDRYADDIQHVYVGEWKASTVGNVATNYLFALGVRHVVRAKTSATGDFSYFRMKERTMADGYRSLSEPYIDTSHWERADYLKFVAADLLLTEEVITDKLTVSKIRSKNDSFVVDADGNVYANNGVFNNVFIGGQSVFTGMVKKAKMIITASNYKQYSEYRNDFGGGYWLLLEKLGGWIDISSGVPFATLIFPGIVFDGYTFGDEARQYVGAQIVIYNRKGSSIALTGAVYLKGNDSFNSVALASGKLAFLECKYIQQSDGGECIGWECIISTIRD